MPAELSLEKLYEKLEGVTKTASVMDEFMKTYKADHETDKEKEASAVKKAEEDKEKEKMEAKKASYDAAIKLAMDEKDHDKKMAAIRKANDDYDDKKHEGMDEPHKEKTAEDKEKDDHVASIIEKDKQVYITKILTASRITNPQNIAEVEKLVKAASITQLKEMAMLVPTFEASGIQPAPPFEVSKIVPFFAATQQPGDVDKNMLTAASPASDFNQMTTKELLEMGQ